MVRMNEAMKMALLASPEPIVRWRMLTEIMSIPAETPEYRDARLALLTSPVVTRLLCDRAVDGKIEFHPYNKWFGGHWILSILADQDYPKGDEALRPMLEQSYKWLLSTEHFRNIQTIEGRVRRCASQEGNCVYYSLALGLADDRTEELANRLIGWQWKDGGWNCDKKPEAINSSFNETLIPFRGLARYASVSGDPKARRAAAEAAEVFLQRRLYKRITDGNVIDPNFILLHYPNYWHYDILFALKVMAEAGFIHDPRCSEALDLLESKQLADGGFPAEARYYRVDDKKLTGHSRVDWGGTSKVHMNPFVTLDALMVLKQAGRLDASI